MGSWRGGRDDTSFPLFHATQHGNYLTVIALLRRGADPKKMTRILGAGSLFVAADYGFLRIAVELLDAGADAHEIKRATGNTALHVASQNGHCAVVQELIRRRADVNARNRQNLTPLVLAIVKAEPT